MNYTKEASANTIFEKFIRLFQLYQELEKTPRSFGTDELLSSSEIHLIEMIGDNDEVLSVTDLARLVGVTKGAISQRLKKLDKKGLTVKEEDPHNISRSIVKLTSKGKAAFFSHRYWHEKMDGGYKNYLVGLDEDKIQFLQEFMDRAEDFLIRLTGPEN
jgi:DNA-binding MarR family transcriptional regulator